MPNTSRISSALPLLAALCGLTMAGCSQTPTIATTRAECAVWPVITYSASQDSAQTVQEVRQANAARKVWCAK